MVTFSACEGEFREEGEQFGGGKVIKNGDEGVECLATTNDSNYKRICKFISFFYF